MQLISNDKTVRSNIAQNLGDFFSQTLATQAKKGEQLVFMMPAIKKAFDSKSDDLVELSTENDSLKNEIGSYDEKWLEKSKTKLSKQFDDEKRASLVTSRMRKQLKKLINGVYVLINYGELSYEIISLQKVGFRYKLYLIETQSKRYLLER